MEWVGSIPVFRNGTVLFYCLVGRIEWFYFFMLLVIFALALLIHKHARIFYSPAIKKNKIAVKRMDQRQVFPW